MNTINIQDIILQETKQLPMELQNEILDFIMFLKSKKNKNSIDPYATLSAMQEDELAHLEDEFTNYKNIYPYE